MADRYTNYERLALKRYPDGILEIVMGAPGKLSTADHVLHRELAEIWRDVDADPETRVAILRGEGKGFSAGGDLKLVEDMVSDFDARARVWREARDLVYNVINCSKPIVSAMHGPAVGAGLVAGLLRGLSLAGGTGEIGWRKYSLNNWLRMAGPTFDASLALEFMGFTGPDVREGIASLREKRAPSFKPGCP